MAKAEGLAEE